MARQNQEDEENLRALAQHHAEQFEKWQHDWEEANPFRYKPSAGLLNKQRMQ